MCDTATEIGLLIEPLDEWGAARFGRAEVIRAEMRRLAEAVLRIAEEHLA